MVESVKEKAGSTAAEKRSAAKSGEEAKRAPARRGRAGARRRGAAAGGRAAAAGGGKGLRIRLLEALKNVEDGDTMIEGTDVGVKQLEKFMGLLDKIDNGERGRKMKDKAQELLSPVETDEGFDFAPEGVQKLVAFLEEEPTEQAGPRRRAGGRAGARAGAAGRGRAGAGGRGARAGAGGRGRAGAGGRGRAGARGARRPGARLR